MGLLFSEHDTRVTNHHGVGLAATMSGEQGRLFLATARSVLEERADYSDSHTVQASLPVPSGLAEAYLTDGGRPALQVLFDDGVTYEFYVEQHIARGYLVAHGDREVGPQEIAAADAVLRLLDRRP